MLYKIAKKIYRKIFLLVPSSLIQFNQENDDSLYKTYQKKSLENKRFYNIGAGNFYHKYWTNIDYSSMPYAQSQTAPFINLNLMEEPELPIQKNSAELFYTSHVIEHITDSAVLKLFSESYRALKPKGIFRIICPDADLLYRTLEFSCLEYWHWRYNLFANYTKDLHEVTLEDFFVREIATERCRFFYPDNPKVLYPKLVQKKFAELDKISFLNFIISECNFSEDRTNCHINWWNEEKLVYFLKAAGFNTIIRSGYQKSLAAPFHNTKKFDTRCPRISIYMEAIK